MKYLKRQKEEDNGAAYITLTEGSLNIDSTYFGRAKVQPLADQDGHAIGYTLTISGRNGVGIYHVV